MKISIITIHLNDIPGLKNTLVSLRQHLQEKRVEWIFIDGGSELYGTDVGVVEEIRSLADHFISEPDKGIYDAMNKGTRLATGEYVLFLNAGDELHPDFELEKLALLAVETGADMIWGRCQERYQNGSLIQVKTRSPSWAWYGMPVCHQAIYFRREVLGDNPYDTRYRIFADYDLVCRLVSNEVKVVHLDSLVSIFHRGGLSNVSGNAAFEEENEIRLKYFQVPAIAGSAIKKFRGLNARLARIAWLRRLWRRWI